MQIEEQAKTWVENHEDIEVRRMFGHYYRAFMAGAEQQAINDREFKYTGLTDKNGTEAQDGDVCEWIRTDGTKQFFRIFKVPGGYAVNTHQDDFKKDPSQIVFYEGLSDMQTSSWFKGNLEIIGNSFLNPDLCK